MFGTDYLAKRQETKIVTPSVEELNKYFSEIVLSCGWKKLAEEKQTFFEGTYFKTSQRISTDTFSKNISSP